MIDMKKGIIITILVNLLFIIGQLWYFKSVDPFAPTHLFALGFVVNLILYLIAACIFIKFYDAANWGKLELVTVINVLVSMACVTLIGIGTDVHMGLVGYMGIASILLGGIGIGKNGCKISLSFVLWGFFILWWTENWYLSVH